MYAYELWMKLRGWEATPFDSWNRSLVIGMAKFFREQLAEAMAAQDNDVTNDLDSADHGIDHAPTWTLLPRWHVRTEQRAAFADDADFVPDGPPMPWEDPDFDVTGFVAWGGGDDVDGGAL